MEDKVKQRLIGVLVIIGALFIILPFLFHNSRPTPGSNLSSNIPKEPSAPAVSVALPAAAPATATATAETTPASVPAATITTTTQVDNPQPSANSGAPANQPATPAVATTTVGTPVAVTTPAPTDSNTAQTPSVAATPTTIPAAPTNTVPANNLTPTNAPTAAPVAPFASPSSKGITTGQANEGPVQSATKQSVAVNDNAPVATPAARIVHHAARPAHHHAAHNVAKGWEIQVGAFSDKANANRLVAKLRERHFEAYARHIVRDHRSITVVSVGPEANLHKMEMIKNNLHREFRLNGEIKKYEA